MKRVSIKNCLVCDGRSLGHLYTCIDPVSGESYDIKYCSTCGFHFTDNFPAEDEIDAYYKSDEYISHSDSKEGLMNKLYHRAREKMLVKKLRMVKSGALMNTGRLLDIGAGTGYFANFMKEAGWDVEAVEKNEKARAFAAEHFSLDIKPETALKDYPPASFDVITLWHVLEHIEPLNETMDLLHKLLKVGGVIVLACPNRISYEAFKYKEYWAGFDVPRHLWHFAPYNIKGLAKRHRFKIQEEYPMHYDGFYISWLSEKNKGSRHPFVKGMWMGLCTWFTTLKSVDASSSLTYVLKRMGGDYNGEK